MQGVADTSQETACEPARAPAERIVSAGMGTGAPAAAASNTVGLG